MEERTLKIAELVQGTLKEVDIYRRCGSDLERPPKTRMLRLGSQDNTVQRGGLWKGTGS